METEERNLQLDQFQAIAFTKNQNYFLSISLHHLLKASLPNQLCTLYISSHSLVMATALVATTEKHN